MSVIQDMQEGEGGVLVNGGGSGGVDKVPCRTNISVWDIERLIKG